MITFAWPLAFLFIPFAFTLYNLVYKWFPPKQLVCSAALIAADPADFDCFKGKEYSSKLTLKTFFAFLTLVLFVTAAARPQKAGDAVQIPKTGRDLMLAIDLSDSMQVRDFELGGKYVDRLTALKVIASDFIDKRKGDRIGLVLFGTNAYIQTPLTFDTSTVKQFLKETEIGLAGGQTAMGDAIALSIKQMDKSPEKNKVLILLTDGNNNAGELNPEKAAEIASRAKLKIHTVAIGSKSGRANMFGFSPIDEAVLQKVAEKTGGKYFRAYNTKELAAIYNEINMLETMEKESAHYVPMKEMYEWPLLMGLICFGILILL